MASYPTSKVHRPSRRRLGKGQHVQLPLVVATLSAAVDVVTITFNVPVVVSGLVPLTVESHSDTPVQAVVDRQTVTLTYNATCAAQTWALAGGGPQVTSDQGGTLAPASGTFS